MHALCYGTRYMIMEEKLDQILRNQELILQLLTQIYKDVNKDHFLEDYTANLAAQLTEIIFNKNIIR